MFPFSRSVKIHHGPVTIRFPRLPDLNRHTAYILLPRLRGLLYRLSRHRLSGRMQITIRKRPDGLTLEIRLPGKKYNFLPQLTIDDCIRIVADWVRFQPNFIR